MGDPTTAVKVVSLMAALSKLYIVAMMFFGMVFTFREIMARVEKEKRMFLILGIFFLNIGSGGLVFLACGVWGAAWEMTERGKRRQNVRKD